MKESLNRETIRDDCYGHVKRWRGGHVTHKFAGRVALKIPAFVPVDAQATFVLMCELHRKGGGRMTSSDGSCWTIQRPGEVAET